MLENKVYQQPSPLENCESQPINSNKITQNLQIDLNIINENDEDSENNKFFDEEESLRYDSTYKPSSIDNNSNSNHLKNKDSNNNNIQRKSSTISTTISVSDNNFDIGVNNINNNFLTPKSYINHNGSHIFFGREKINTTPIYNYLEGTDNYLKGLNPEKSDYQKSNNYFEKKKFFREHFYSLDLMKYNNKEKINTEKSPKKSVDIDINSKSETKKKTQIYNHNLINSINNLNVFSSGNNINNTNINNNILNAPSQNNSKFDLPMNYFSYYNVNCKSYI